MIVILVWLIFGLLAVDVDAANINYQIKCFNCFAKTGDGPLCNPIDLENDWHKGDNLPCPNTTNAAELPFGQENDTDFACYIMKKTSASTGRIEISKGCIAMIPGFFIHLSEKNDNDSDKISPVGSNECGEYGPEDKVLLLESKIQICFCDTDNCNEKELVFKLPNGTKTKTKIGRDDIEQVKMLRENGSGCIIANWMLPVLSLCVSIAVQIILKIVE